MEAITREEKIMSGENLTPITRKEMFLAKAAGQDVETPEPITREEMFLSKINGSGGGTPGGGTGGGDLVKQLIDGTIEEFADDTITILRPQAFANCRKLTTATLPNVETLGAQAFYNCVSLTTADYPKVSNGESTVFYGCSNLRTANFPILTTIGYQMFYNCSKLKNINAPNVTNIDNQAFVNSGVTKLLFPKLASAIIPFNNCAELKLVDFGLLTKLDWTMNCPKLDTIVLRANSVCALSGSHNLHSTPFGVGKAGGTAYVPQALIESYQTETNWSTLYTGGTCNFVAIEGSEYE